MWGAFYCNNPSLGVGQVFFEMWQICHFLQRSVTTFSRAKGALTMKSTIYNFARFVWEKGKQSVTEFAGTKSLTLKNKKLELPSALTLEDV